MSSFLDYPVGWADTVNQLRRKLVAPVLLTLKALEDHNWNIENAESWLRQEKGYGGRS